jgi:hypothetical protein
LIALAVAVGALLLPVAGQAGGAPVLAWSPTTGSGTYDYGTVDGVGGATKTVTFTVDNSGGMASGSIKVTLTNTSGTAFSVMSDGCTGTSLGPKKSCQVTVEYAPGGEGSFSATLTATGEHATTTITLTGSGGAADLTLSPGRFQFTMINGANLYDYGVSPPLIGQWPALFTVTNNGTGTSDPLQITHSVQFNFVVSENGCTGTSLAPGDSCTFFLNFIQLEGCPAFFEIRDQVLVSSQATGTPYIDLDAHGTCAPV